MFHWDRGVGDYTSLNKQALLGSFCWYEGPLPPSPLRVPMKFQGFVGAFSHFFRRVRRFGVLSCGLGEVGFRVFVCRVWGFKILGALRS